MIALTAQELHGRWGTWFISLSLGPDSISAVGTIELHLSLGRRDCAGYPGCGGNGRCVDGTDGSRWCKCFVGWYGYFCEVRFGDKFATNEVSRCLWNRC